MFRKAEKPYVLDKDKIFHFFPDCLAIEGKTKRVEHIGKYHLCSLCEARQKLEIHRINLKLKEHHEENIANFVKKIDSSNLTDVQKTQTFLSGILGMGLIEGLYNSADELKEDHE